MLTGIPMSFEDGQVIFKQGAAAADMYVISSGSVRISRTMEDGSDKVLAYLSSGDVFGEMAVFRPGPRTATATAVGEVQVEVVDRPTLLDALDKDPALQTMVDEIKARMRGLNESASAPAAQED